MPNPPENKNNENPFMPSNIKANGANDLKNSFSFLATKNNKNENNPFISNASNNIFLNNNSNNSKSENDNLNKNSNDGNNNNNIEQKDPFKLYMKKSENNSFLNNNNSNNSTISFTNVINKDENQIKEENSTKINNNNNSINSNNDKNSNLFSFLNKNKESNSNSNIFNSNNNSTNIFTSNINKSTFNTNNNLDVVNSNVDNLNSNPFKDNFKENNNATNTKNRDNANIFKTNNGVNNSDDGNNISSNKNFDFKNMVKSLNKIENTNEQNINDNENENINEKKANHKYEFLSTPEKPLEIIKEDEELKLKKESDTKDFLNDNKSNNLTIFENDSEQEKNSIKDDHINFGSTNNIFKIDKRQINEKSNEDNSSITNEEKKENKSYNENENANNLDEGNNIINIDKLINFSNNEEELNKIVSENCEHIEDMLKEYNNSIIDNIIDLDIKNFKNNINEFILYSKEKINKIQILDDLCDKIKEKLIISFEIIATQQKNNISEYTILSEYEQKLDYIIYLQNKMINDLEIINNDLKMNLNAFDNKNSNENEISDEQMNKNLNETNHNMNKLENFINDNFMNKNELNSINISNFNENDNFFDVLKNIYEPLKEINKAYQQIILLCNSINNK